jgi:predicted metal-dependent hydrolase
VRDTRTVLLDGHSYPYTLRRSRRARHILLHVELNGSIEVVVPWHTAFRQAEDFIIEREDWLRNALSKNGERRQALPTRHLDNGEALPFFGDEQILRVDIRKDRQLSTVRDRDTVVTVYTNHGDKVRSLLERWYCRRSQDYFIGQAITMASHICVRVQAVRVLNTRSQWGSCNKSKRTLTFHWRLALAPEAVARYVVAHEVAHLKQSNHSPKYWSIVRELDPAYQHHRRWLRQHGYALVL